MSYTLVLGAGGTVGMAHHAGSLRALAEHGFDPAGADLVIGTSAGAVMGAVLRSGHSVDELWAAGQGADVEGFPPASTGPDRAETVVIVAPMAYDLDDRPQLAQQVIRSTSTRRVHVEADRLRRRGHRVILLVPSSVEIAQHGFELIRDDDHAPIARLAYERASARLAKVVPPSRERLHAVN